MTGRDGRDWKWRQAIAGALLACVWFGCSLISYGVPYGWLKSLLLIMVLAGVSGCVGFVARHRRSISFGVSYFACLLLVIPLDLLYDYHYAEHVGYIDPETYVFMGVMLLLANSTGFVVGAATGTVLFYEPPVVKVPGEQ